MITCYKRDRNQQANLLGESNNCWRDKKEPIRQTMNATHENNNRSNKSDRERAHRSLRAHLIYKKNG